MGSLRAEYTLATGKMRAENSAVKSLLYGGPNMPPDNSRKYATKQQGATPFATFEDSEEDKYPSTFHMRKKGREGSEKIGGNRDFDPEVYRQKIVEYNASKIDASRRAYTGAGDILHHAGASRPISVDPTVAIREGNTCDAYMPTDETSAAEKLAAH